MKRYYVYIMTSPTGTLYTGITNSLKRRVYEHKQKRIEGFTKRYNITRLVYFEETNEGINRKIVALLPLDLVPILCIGETLEEREAGETLRILADQLSGSLEKLDEEQGGRLVVAYEPVWAIGTGQTATPDQAQEAHAFVRETLAERFNQTVANNIRILYGGSVNSENVDELMAKPDIDGALVGGASLKAESFVRIVDFES